jgi:hypothetical protein
MSMYIVFMFIFLLIYWNIYWLLCLWVSKARTVAWGLQAAQAARADSH